MFIALGYIWNSIDQKQNLNKDIRTINKNILFQNVKSKLVVDKIIKYEIVVKRLILNTRVAYRTRVISYGYSTVKYLLKCITTAVILRVCILALKSSHPSQRLRGGVFFSAGHDYECAAGTGVGKTPTEIEPKSSKKH